LPPRKATRVLAAGAHKPKEKQVPHKIVPGFPAAGSSRFSVPNVDPPPDYSMSGPPPRAGLHLWPNRSPPARAEAVPRPPFFPWKPLGCPKVNGKKIAAKPFPRQMPGHRGWSCALRPMIRTLFNAFWGSSKFPLRRPELLEESPTSPAHGTTTRFFLRMWKIPPFFRWGFWGRGHAFGGPLPRQCL